MDAATDTHALENLIHEHRLIATTVDALEAFVERLELNVPTDHRDLERFATFFIEFGQAVHHTKEEDFLLPAMVKRGFGWDEGPVWLVRADHDQERYLVRVLKQAGMHEGEWNDEGRRHAIASIRAFIDYQRRHIRKEEDILYPAAMDRLTVGELKELDDRLRTFDEERAGLDELRRLHRMAAELTQQYRR